MFLWVQPPNKKRTLRPRRASHTHSYSGCLTGRNGIRYVMAKFHPLTEWSPLGPQCQGTTKTNPRLWAPPWDSMGPFPIQSEPGDAERCSRLCWCSVTLWTTCPIKATLRPSSVSRSKCLCVPWPGAIASMIFFLHSLSGALSQSAKTLTQHTTTPHPEIPSIL